MPMTWVCQGIICSWRVVMGFKYIPLILAGLAVTAWGMPAAYRLRSPWQIPAALAALAGVVAFLAGTLLLAVPDFFAG